MHRYQNQMFDTQSHDFMDFSIILIDISSRNNRNQIWSFLVFGKNRFLSQMTCMLDLRIE